MQNQELTTPAPTRLPSPLLENDSYYHFEDYQPPLYQPQFPSFELPLEEDGSKKRRSQVKIACIHCKKSCKKCDEQRPCQRCVRIGFSMNCIDAPRKIRKRGFKRGPYKTGRRESEDGFDDGFFS